MKITRFFKTIFMTDFIGGLLIAIKELLDQKKLLIIHSKKEKLVQDTEESTLLGGILMVKKDVLLVNYVKQSVLLKQ